ncbi:hypothetical protein ACFPN4_12620 [Ureibacillus thermophilus]|uniref:Uncharacterized protein n=1 Tax=Ureibacillus thermophilus TaxID=367743 RepID=A0A4P6USN0_9BACL|nr:hypothetical protein [Ureibacillus thermophilus]QBK26329.1 hypothetical protein DKZ56_10890 [Ureibacillus thermophilus]
MYLRTSALIRALSTLIDEASALIGALSTQNDGVYAPIKAGYALNEKLSSLNRSSKRTNGNSIRTK